MREHFNVTSFHFNQKKKWLIPIEFLRHVFHVIKSIRKTDCYVSFFAGYSSFVPALIARWSEKPHVIVLGGTDCVSIPEIGYGNFQKKLLGWCTCESLKRATRLAPVSLNLVDSDYTYFPTRFKHQGYKAFCKKATAPFEVIPIGYDGSAFNREGNKQPRSFLTVAQMNEANFFRKGIDLIFEMASRFPDCNFTVVGNTDTMKYDSIPDNAVLSPFVPYEQLAKIYSEHRFYLQLSLMEGFPSAPCEAMLCECVPIVSAVGAMEEIVGNTGFVLKRKDLSALEEILKTALSSDAEYLGKAARRRIIEKYPIGVRRQLIELINTELKSSQPSPSH